MTNVKTEYDSKAMTVKYCLHVFFIVAANR